MKKKRLLVPVILSSVMLAGTISTSSVSAIQAENTVRNLQDNSIMKDKNHVPIFVSEKNASRQNASDAENAIQYLQKNKDKFGIENSKVQFSKKDTKKDQLGMTHVRLQQSKNGVPVEGAEIIVHYDKNNVVKTVNGDYNQSIEESDISTDPSLSTDIALQEAKKSVEAPKTLEYDPTTELVLYPYNDKNHLAYKVNVNFLGKTPGNWFVYVDAHTGSVIDKYNALMHADGYKSTKGSGTGVLGDHRKLHISQKNDRTDSTTGSMFYLLDQSHENLDGIYTYDFKNQWRSSDIRLPGELFSGIDAAWNEDYDKPGVDAHYNSEEVYDYFLNEHDRNSIDGNGMAIVSTVHYGQDYNNAFWNGQQMTYGDGDGKFFIPLSAGLDVAAHEMTHGVTTNTAGLKYRFQSGALNEAFSDIFGALVDEEDWEIGEDIMADEAVATGRTSLRSLSDPSKFPVGKDYWAYGDGNGKYPSHMDEYYDLPLNLDNGGVHINSSIINHAAYITGEQIGKQKLGQIYYRALTVYLTPNSTFSEARQALILSAEDLYGEGSVEAIATKDGYDKVGIVQ